MYRASAISPFSKIICLAGKTKGSNFEFILVIAPIGRFENRFISVIASRKLKNFFFEYLHNKLKLGLLQVKQT